MIEETYRLRVWRCEGDPSVDLDPETYWLSAEEVVSVIDAVTATAHVPRGGSHLRSIEVVPLSELPLAELLAGYQEALF